MPVDKALEEALPSVEVPEVSVEKRAYVAKRLVAVAFTSVVVVAKRTLEVRLLIVVVARVVTPRNVLSPAKICVVVETRPRAV